MDSKVDPVTFQYTNTQLRKSDGDDEFQRFIQKDDKKGIESENLFGNKIGETKFTVNLNKPATGTGKDRREEANEWAKKSQDSHIRLYSPAIKWVRGTRPIKKSVEAFNSVKGSGETADQTMDRWEAGIYAFDFILTLLIFRSYLFFKDTAMNLTYNAVGKGDQLVKMFPASVPVPLRLLCIAAIGLPFVTLVLPALLLFLVPTICVLFVFLLVPAFFFVPLALTILFVTNKLPNKHVSRMNFFGKKEGEKTNATGQKQ